MSKAVHNRKAQEKDEGHHLSLQRPSNYYPRVSEGSQFVNVPSEEVFGGKSTLGLSTSHIQDH